MKSLIGACMGIDESEAKYVFQSIALSCVFHSLTYKLTSSTYLKDYPIKMDKKDINEGQRSTRSNYRGDIVLQGKNDLCHTSILYDASKHLFIQSKKGKQKTCFNITVLNSKNSLNVTYTIFIIKVWA